MVKSFKNGVSLHRLLEASPLNTLRAFLFAADNGKYAAKFRDVNWSADLNTDNPVIRRHLFEIANDLHVDEAVPLDHHAYRILTLAEGRGVETVNHIAKKKLEKTDIDVFAAQLGDFGRSLWLYHHLPKLFEEAENLFYTDHYRNFGRMYEAFELGAADTKVDLVWNEDIKTKLEDQLQSRFKLTGRCTVTHFEVGKKNSSGKETLQHMLVVRHGGPLSSIAEYLEVDGSRQEHYYRPLNEATLLFSPDEGVIEVFSSSPTVRSQLAESVAETVFEVDLSSKPLTLKQYNLTRFLESLRLESQQNQQNWTGTLVFENDNYLHLYAAMRHRFWV